MRKLSLEYIQEWLNENRPEFELCTDNIYEGNKKKLRFLHSTCREYFHMRWNDVVTGFGCPVCNGKQVGERNNLKYLYEEVIDEWDYKKNYPLTPENVTYGSNKVVWWICRECKYEWKSTVKSRSRGNGCPACAGKVVTNNNSLLALFPEIAREWHRTKNGTLTPDKVTYGSKKNIWWECIDCGFEWSTTPNKRTYRRDGCPNCSSSRGEKRISQFLVSKNILFYQEYKIEDCKNILPLPFDFYLSDYNMLIEYDGEFHYEDIFNNPKELKEVKRRDKIKTKYCKDNNINLLRIPYLDFDNIEKILNQSLFS